MANHGNIRIIESSESEEESDNEIQSSSTINENQSKSAVDDKRGDTKENLYEDIAAPDEKVIHCKTKHHCLFLKSTSFGSDVSNLRVEFSEMNCTITLQGPKEVVLAQSLRCFECLGRVCSSSEPVSATRFSILQRKGCIEELRQKSKSFGKDFYVYLKEDQSTNDPMLHCIAYTEEDAKLALQTTLGIFRKMEVPFATHHVELFTTTHWDSVTEGLQESLMVVIEIVHTRSVVEVEGLPDDSKKAADKVKEMIKAHKPMKTLSLSGAKARLFCKSHTLQEELLRLKEEAKQDQEMLYTAEAHNDPECTLTIKFTDGSTLGKRIQKLIDQAKDLKLTLDDVSKNGTDQEAITRCLNSQKGRRELRNWEEKYKVYIDVVNSSRKITIKYIEDNSPRYSPMTHSRSKSMSNLDVQETESLTVGSTDLVVKGGSVVKERASILVNVLRKSSMWKYGQMPRLFSSASRQLQQDFEDDYDGEENVVLTQSSEKLTRVCEFVCTIILEDWDKGNTRKHEQGFREVVKTCLRHCEENQADSIAFPAVGTGKLLKFPANTVSKIMFEECIAWCKGKTTLKKIVFVIHDKDERQNFEDSLEFWRKNLSKKTGFQRFETMLSMIRKKNPSDQQTKSKDSDSGETESKVLCLPHLLLYGENTRLKDSRKKIAEEMERHFLSKEIIPTKGSDIIAPEEKQEIFETVREMSVVLQLDSDKYVIIGHKDDVQALANKIRALLLSNVTATSSRPTKPRRWTGPRSRKGTEDYWKEVLENRKTPLYWKKFRGGYDIQYHLRNEESCQVNDVDQDTFTAISELVEATWDQSHVGHGADAKNLSHQNIKVKKIERVESIELFSQYSHQRETIIRRMLKSGLTSYPKIAAVTQNGDVMTTVKMSKLLNTSLYLDINEHYVFHGTKSTFIENITKKGIDPRKSGDRLLFGQGIYCAESSTKADQYTDGRDRRQQTGLKMLLVRLLIGNPFVSGKEKNYKHPPCTTCKTTDCITGEHFNYDSVIVEGKWLFREFVIYEPHQCYPEYIITYDRV